MGNINCKEMLFRAKSLSVIIEFKVVLGIYE